MSEFKEYKYQDKDNDDTVIARKVDAAKGEDVVLPGGERVHAAKGDYVIQIPASAYGYHEVVRASDKVLADTAKRPSRTPAKTDSKVSDTTNSGDKTNPDSAN